MLEGRAPARVCVGGGGEGQGYCRRGGSCPRQGLAPVPQPRLSGGCFHHAPGFLGPGSSRPWSLFHNALARIRSTKRRPRCVRVPWLCLCVGCAQAHRARTPLSQQRSHMNPPHRHRQRFLPPTRRTPPQTLETKEGRQGGAGLFFLARGKRRAHGTASRRAAVRRRFAAPVLVGRAARVQRGWLLDFPLFTHSISTNAYGNVRPPLAWCRSRSRST